MNSALTRSTSVRDDLSVGTSVATLAAACEDAGWPVHLREKGLSLTVNLDTPGSIRQAVGGANSRGLTLSTELTILPGLPGAELQRAAAIFLLKTAGAVRLARPFVRLSDGQCVLGFEVTWPGSANAAAVGHALAALSVAAELTARELKALANPLVATLYLKDHDIIHEHAMSALLNLAADLIERAAPDRESAAEYLEAHRQYVDQ